MNNPKLRQILFSKFVFNFLTAIYFFFNFTAFSFYFANRSDMDCQAGMKLKIKFEWTSDM